jgi:hypothetical protein
MKRPNKLEYKPYFQHYINLVPDGNFFILYRENTETILTFFSGCTETQLNHRYQEGKWSIKQVLMHIIDTERVLSYRAFVGTRLDDKTLLHSYDDDEYAVAARGDERTLSSLLEEFELQRRTTLILFENSSLEQQQFKANAVDSYITPRAIGYIILGHALHHLQVIKDRYL